MEFEKLFNEIEKIRVQLMEGALTYEEYIIKIFNHIAEAIEHGEMN